MDSHDHKIIAELRRDARLSLSDLEQIVGLSRATVRTRIKKLEDQGAIIGYTVVLAEDMQVHPVRGLMMLAIEGRGTDRISRVLGGIGAVRAIHSTIGKWDLIIELGAETLEVLDQVLSDIRRLDGVTASETNLMLRTKLASKA